MVKTKYIPPKSTAGNPIAKMLAKQKLERSLVKMKIYLYSSAKGDEMQSAIKELSKLLVITLLACRIDKIEDYNIEMDDALRFLCTMAEAGFVWDPASVVLIDDALDAVVLVTPKIRAHTFQVATKRVDEMILEEIRNDQTSTVAT
jgi:hypothetical protein